MVGVDAAAMPVAAPDRHVFVEPVMGTIISLDVRSPSPPAPAVGEVLAWLHAVDATYSTYRADSVVSRLRSGELARGAAPAEVRDVLTACEDLRRRTGGAFDAGVGTERLDPSAYVKGWAVQRGAEILSGHGLTDFCLGAGGDVVVRGGAQPARVWSVGIQHPGDRDAIAAVVAATDLAIATSGSYERGEHIVDPRSATAPRGVASVTVAGPDLGTADALSTAAFAMGLDGPAWTLTLAPYEALTILADGRVLSTPGFPFAAESAA
jgi:thiamine biosynthesis lipoprotein